MLGNACLVHLSCNSSFVWSVDSEGQVFHRIGASAPRPGHLNPVWLPIDTFSEIIFTKVFCGPVDWMVRVVKLDFFFFFFFLNGSGWHIKLP